MRSSSHAASSSPRSIVRFFRWLRQRLDYDADRPYKNLAGAYLIGATSAMGIGILCGSDIYIVAALYATGGYVVASLYEAVVYSYSSVARRRDG